MNDIIVNIMKGNKTFMNDFKFFTNLNESFTINEGLFNKAPSDEELEILKSQLGEELKKANIMPIFSSITKDMSKEEKQGTTIIDFGKVVKNAYFEKGKLTSKICIFDMKPLPAFFKLVPTREENRILREYYTKMGKMEQALNDHCKRNDINLKFRSVAIEKDDSFAILVFLKHRH